MNEHVEYSAKPAGSVTKFLWYCAGADEDILKYSSYADHVKYVGLGGVVLATGVMAALSMGFAIHIIFDGNWMATIPVAIIWSLIVFNLDRFIVSSTGKGDGKDTISGKELVNALPRLLMATLLGLTISAPLETYLFKNEIEREWKLSMDQLATSKIAELERNSNVSGSAINSRLEKLEEDVKVQQEVVNKLSDTYQEEITGGRGGRGNGPEAKAIEKQLNEEKQKLKDIENERDKIRLEQKNSDGEKKSKLDSMQNEIKNLRPGFLDRIMMLERLSSKGKTIEKIDVVTKKPIPGQEEEIYGSAFWPIWMVRLLFMIIEIVPVIFKLMLIKSPYDYMSENINQILEAKQGISLQHIPDENNKMHNIKENYNPKRIISIVEHQNAKEEENAKAAVTAFAEKERKDIEENPDKYIRS